MLPSYWQDALRQLADIDSVMAALAARYRDDGLISRGDAFGTLARSIVGQQISVRAADTIWNRFLGVVKQVEPEAVLLVGTVGLAGCGLSRRKIEYLVDLASHFASGRIVAEHLKALGDEEVIASLTDVRGIGRWTAEMFLIFNLRRADVFPLDDIGLQRAVSQHYFSGVKPTRRALAAFGERWRPWRSVATWLLWRSLDPVPVAY